MTEQEIINFTNANPTALVLKREYLPNITKGNLKGYINNVLMVDINTLELKDNGNKQGISCIPEGIYDIKPSIWNKYNKKVLEIYGVPDRSEILIHPANFASGVNVQLKGCIAPCTSYADIDGDGIIDGTSSVNAFNNLMKIFGKVKCKILIYS